MNESGTTPRARAISRYVVPQPPPPQPVAVAIPRPVDQERLAFDLVPLHEPPVAAVLRVVAVVAHHEERVGGNRRRLTPVRVAAVGAAAVAERRPVTDVRLHEALAVDVDLLAADDHAVAGRAHDPLDEVPLL